MTGRDQLAYLNNLIADLQHFITRFPYEDRLPADVLGYYRLIVGAHDNLQDAKADLKARMEQERK